MVAVGGSNHMVTLWDVHTGARVGWPMTGHGKSIRALAFGSEHPGAPVLLAIAGEDHTVALHLATSGKALYHLKDHKACVRSLAFGANAGGALLLASGGEDGTVLLWNVTGDAQRRHGRPLSSHAGWVSGVAFGALVPGGPKCLLASGSEDGKVQLWDCSAAPEGALRVLEPGGDQGCGGVYCVALSRAGPADSGPLLLAAGCGNGKVYLWNLDVVLSVTGGQGALVMQGHALEGHALRVASVSFAQQGPSTTLASGSDDCTVRVWDVVTRTLVWASRSHAQCLDARGAGLGEASTLTLAQRALLLHHSGSVTPGAGAGGEGAGGDSST